MVKCVTCQHWGKGPLVGGDAMARKGYGTCKAVDTIESKATYKPGGNDRECGMHAVAPEQQVKVRRAFISQQDRKFSAMIKKVEKQWSRA